MSMTHHCSNCLEQTEHQSLLGHDDAANVLEKATAVPLQHTRTESVLIVFPARIFHLEVHQLAL